MRSEIKKDDAAHKNEQDHNEPDIDPEPENTLDQDDLQDGREELGDQAGVCRTKSKEPGDQKEVYPEVDQEAAERDDVEGLQVAIGSEKGAEDIGQRYGNETTHQDAENI